MRNAIALRGARRPAANRSGSSPNDTVAGLDQLGLEAALRRRPPGERHDLLRVRDRDEGVRTLGTMPCLVLLRNTLESDDKGPRLRIDIFADRANMFSQPQLLIKENDHHRSRCRASIAKKSTAHSAISRLSCDLHPTGCSRLLSRKPVGRREQDSSTPTPAPCDASMSAPRVVARRFGPTRRPRVCSTRSPPA